MVDISKLELYEPSQWWYTSLWHRWWFLFFIAAACLFCFLLLWLISRRLIKRSTKQESLAMVLERLQSIKIDYFQDPDSHKAFYNQLTMLIKNYLAKRFCVSLSSKTDYEVCSTLEQTAFPPQLLESLYRILHGGQAIKFGNQQAMREQMKYHLMLAINIVKVTLNSEETRGA